MLLLEMVLYQPGLFRIFFPGNRVLRSKGPQLLYQFMHFLCHMVVFLVSAFQGKHS